VTDRIDVTLRTPTFQAALFGLFGVIALASAAVGLYGVCSFEVALRRREMGVRLALGGSRRDLQHMVVAHAIRPALIGVAAGLLFAYWAAKFLQSFLHQVDARDPWTLALVATVLILTASAAAWLPARRASRLSPADILRAM
jgi:ABC-type antimicrobial peptide transport system permease subunit